MKALYAKNVTFQAWTIAHHGGKEILAIESIYWIYNHVVFG